jgi:hypothetical protein
VTFTGVEELEVKLMVWAMLGPFTGEVTVTDGGVAIKVVVDVAGVMMRVTGSWSGEFVALE